MSDFVSDQVSRNCRLIIPRATRVTDFLGEKCGQKTVIIRRGWGGGVQNSRKVKGKWEGETGIAFPKVKAITIKKKNILQY